MKSFLHTEENIIHYLQPESDLENEFLQNPTFRNGLFWGMPRFGHPEGKVIYHIREVLDNIDKLSISAEVRQRLRIITFVHDTFKYKEHKGTPRDWSQHHAVLARQFLEQYTQDEQLLHITELHDEAYYAWRLSQLQQNPKESDLRMANIYDKLNGSIQLYYLFFKCDTCTGDKNPAPLIWFEKTVQDINIVQLSF